jgi:hypothetical protein
VALPVFIKWHRSKKKIPGPSSWARGVGGGSVRSIEMGDALGLVSRDRATRSRALLACNIKPGEALYVNAVWQEPMRAVSKNFIASMERLRDAANGIGDVRIVFGFDS